MFIWRSQNTLHKIAESNLVILYSSTEHVLLGEEMCEIVLFINSAVVGKSEANLPAVYPRKFPPLEIFKTEDKKNVL